MLTCGCLAVISCEPSVTDTCPGVWITVAIGTIAVHTKTEVCKQARARERAAEGRRGTHKCARPPLLYTFAGLTSGGFHSIRQQQQQDLYISISSTAEIQLSPLQVIMRGQSLLSSQTQVNVEP
jgi:hypothetical protein